MTYFIKIYQLILYVKTISSHPKNFKKSGTQFAFPYTELKTNL